MSGMCCSRPWTGRPRCRARRCASCGSCSSSVRSSAPSAGCWPRTAFPDRALEWAACGALFGLSTVALGYGTALIASSVKLPSWGGSLAAVGLVAAAILGALAAGRQAGAVFGSMALWPLQFDALGLIQIALGVGALALGLHLVGDVSVEAAERRSTLVGQLRFAATLQDIRTVIVLRRQLAMELPRVKPWVRVRVRGTDRFPVWTRGVRGIFRWPAARVARLVLLGAVAGFAARGAWTGTTPLVVVSGLALFIAALDAVEPLAQEIDHPSRRESVPLDDGWVELRHVPVAVLMMLLVAIVGAVAAVVVAPSKAAIPIAAACVIPAALGRSCGRHRQRGGGRAFSRVAVMRGACCRPRSRACGSPSARAGRRRWPCSGRCRCWPPAPRPATTRPRPPPRSATGIGVLVLFVLVCGWLRSRSRIHGWWKAQMELAGRG